VLRAAHPGRVFLERAKSRNGLAGVEQDRAGAGDCVDIAPGQRGNPGQMLDTVERRPLSSEHCPCQAPQAEQYVAGTGMAALLDPTLDLDLWIKRAEERLGNRQAGDDDRLAA